ncbi:MAG: peptidylprolyl isomerase [Candidatus Aminicenantes bacterium]|nr:peptidylprolyl isomerase [Candidatus Aminicenantes bacterium]
MKKIIALALVLGVVGAACSPKKIEGTRLVAGTPAYQLAKNLSEVLPLFDPDKNAVLFEAKKFTVTVGDVTEVIQNTMGNAASQLAGRGPAALKSAALQAAVQIGERRLLMAAAEAAKVSVSPEELNKAQAGQYEKAGGEDKFLEMLKTNNVDVAFFKKMVSEEQTIGKYLEANVFNKISVGEDELQKAYAADKTATVRHILLLTQGKPESEIPAIRKKMEDILARANKGEDFAALAREFTEDPGSKENGGLYENFPRGTMVKSFENAAFTVPVGEISGIVETKYGFHILKVENRMKETEPFEKVRAGIEDGLKLAKRADVYEKFVAGLKSKAGFAEVKS